MDISGKKDGHVYLNSKFEHFIKDYGLKVYACWPNIPQTKGKVEKQMDFLDGLKAYNGEYTDSNSINQTL